MASALVASVTKPLNGFGEITSFIWAVADLLRGDYKQADYGKVILPLTVLRRLDCVLQDTKDKVLHRHEALKGGKVKNLDPLLNRITSVPFHNISKLDFAKLKGDPNHIAANFAAYIRGFSANAREVIERFKFAEQIAKLDESNLLFQVIARFAEIDLHPKAVPNHVMGSIFEELIRRLIEDLYVKCGGATPLDHDPTPAQDPWGQRAIAMPTLTFAPSKRPLRVRRRIHGGARTWSDGRCPSGGGVSRSYAPEVT